MRFLRSAFRHGVTEEDIRHALANQWRSELPDDGLEIVIGLDTGGRLLEIGVRTAETGESIVVHAMRARPKFLR